MTILLCIDLYFDSVIEFIRIRKVPVESAVEPLFDAVRRDAVQMEPRSAN